MYKPIVYAVVYDTMLKVYKMAAVLADRTVCVGELSCAPRTPGEQGNSERFVR